jgi:hypothetical protein
MNFGDELIALHQLVVDSKEVNFTWCVRPKRRGVLAIDDPKVWIDAWYDEL